MVVPRLPASRPRRYSRPAIALHWLMAALILSQIAVAFLLGDAPKDSPERAILFSWHATLAMVILIVWPIRLLWRMRHVPPVLPYTVSALQVFLARQTHYWMYVLMLLMPLTGWTMVSAPDREILLIGGFVLPPMPGAELVKGCLESLGVASIGQLHHWLAWGLIGLICLHVLAAMLHHFVFRDEVLLRMAPSLTHPLLHRLRGSRR